MNLSIDNYYTAILIEVYITCDGYKLSNMEILEKTSNYVPFDLSWGA
jgi:hypothetical protein